LGVGVCKKRCGGGGANVDDGSDGGVNVEMRKIFSTYVGSLIVMVVGWMCL